MNIKVLNTSDFITINESTEENKGIVEAFLKVPPIKMADGNYVQPSKFVNVVSSAMYMFETKHPWEYQFIKYARILYLLDSRITKTMCVDEYGDLYINVEFLYSFLKMNPKYIMYILYHEAMHNILNHVERGRKYGEVKGEKNKLTWHEMNICADFEVNGQMVSDRVCSSNDWDILKGCYDTQFNGMTFEMIADNKNKIKNIDTDFTWNPKTGGPKDSQSGMQGERPSNPDYDKGYADMDNAIKDLLTMNGHDKQKTEKQISSIITKTQKPDEILNEIKKIVENIPMQYITVLNSKLFESAQSNADWMSGLNAALIDGLKKLMQSGGETMTSEEAAESAEKSAEEAEAAAEAAEEAAEEARKNSGGDNEDEVCDAEEKAQQARDAANEAREAAERAREAAENGDTEKANEEAQNAKNALEKAKNPGSTSDEFDGDDSGESSMSDGSGDTIVDRSSKAKNKELSDNKHNTPNKGNSKADVKTPETNIGGTEEMVGRIIKRSEIQQNLKDSLADSGYNTDEIDRIYDEVYSKFKEPEQLKAESIKMRDAIIAHKKNSTLAKLCSQVNVDEKMTDEIWEEIVRKFLERTTVYRGSDPTMDDESSILWGNKKYLSLDDIILPYQEKTDAAPQYINIFIDKSGSIDAKLCMYFIGIIRNLCDKLEFSGLRLIPFADTIPEHMIFTCTADELNEGGEDATKAIEGVIDNYAKSSEGGLGNSTSFKCIADYIAKMNIYEPDSVYFVLTDGGLFDTHNIIKYKPFSERILFCIADYDIKDTLKNNNSYLSWCVNPKYEFLEKLYIDLEETKL